MKRLSASVVGFALLFLTVSPCLAQKTKARSGGPFSKGSVLAPAAVPQTFVRAASDGNGVWVSWDSSVESNERAFQVFRLDHMGAQPVNAAPVPKVIGGQGLLDPNGTLSSTYIVEAIDSAGSRRHVAQVPVSYVPDLDMETGGHTAAASQAEMGSAPGLYSSYQFNISPDVAAGIDPGMRPTNPGIQRMVAAQGGVKLGIKEDGFYRVTRAQLAAGGFNVESDHTKWRLFLDGIEQAIIVEPAGNYIEFFAKSKEVIETDTRYLYLINGTVEGRRMPSRTPADNGSQIVAPGFDQFYFAKQRLNYVSDIINGDADNWWGSPISSSPALNIPFTLAGVDTTTGSAVIKLKFQGFVGANHSVAATLNGQSLGSFQGTGMNPFDGEATVPTSVLVNGTNTLSLTGVAGSVPLFDSITVEYKRKFEADENRLNFYTIPGRRSVIGNFSSPNIRLFDVMADHQPVEVTGLNIVPSGSSFAINYPAHRARLYHAVEDSGIQQVVSVVPNYPSTLSTAAHHGRMVIITHRNFLAEANAWANYRRSQEIAVEVVDIDDTYDEFNFGMATTQAITNFLNYARQNWQTPPQYVLLVGDASFDPKNYLNLPNSNFVPSKIVNTVYLETGSDEALADFNNDGLAEMAIGRIPARTPANVTQSLNKTMTFETPAMQNMNRGIICAYDEPNGYDFAGMCQELMSEFPAPIPTIMIDRLAPNSGQTIINQINQGRYLANYSGHGTTGTWHSVGFFSAYNLIPGSGYPQVANGDNLTIFTMLTCLNGYFINAYGDSLSEYAQKFNNGGSAANWASTGKTTPDVQLIMGRRFFDQMAAGTMPRLGDLIKDAKSVIPGGSDVKLSWALIGDPMLKVHP
jgi:hypothetical protein